MPRLSLKDVDDKFKIGFIIVGAFMFAVQGYFKLMTSIDNRKHNKKIKELEIELKEKQLENFDEGLELNERIKQHEKYFEDFNKPPTNKS